MRSVFRAAFFAAALLLGGCAAAPARAPTLFDRMGGERVVRVVVSDIVDHTSSDPRTARSFEHVRLSRLKQALYEQVCVLAGGPCTYNGDPVDVVHRGLHVTEAEFYAMVQIVRDALGRAGVAEREKNELLRQLAPMKRSVVNG